MSAILKNLASDPWANDTFPEYYTVESTYYSGDYENIVAPSSPNFPVITPTRYFIDLPVTPFVDDTTTYPIQIRDVTTGVDLTYTAGSPGVNQYRYSPSTSKTPQKIEINAAQAGKTIGFSYSGLGSIISENNWNLYAITGSIVLYGAASAPDGWLICDGSAVSRTTYVTLFDVLGITWGSGDGSTTFNLPDFRAASPSGVGTSTGYTQNETIALATKYNDRFQGHYHGASGQYLRNDAGGAYYYLGSTGTVSLDTLTPITDGTNGTPRTGNTTRGKIVGVNYIIKY